MNRALLITVGIVVILLVILLWVFLLLNGTPERPQQIFSDLGIIPETQPTERTQEFNEDVQTQQVSISNDVLQQLTTEAIAGFGFVTNEDAEAVYYAEKGTGYLYAIDLDTGSKKQISLTTTQGTEEAVFSPDGYAVVLTTSNATFAAFIPNDPEDTLEKIALPAGIQNIAFVEEGTVQYTKSSQNNTIAYTFDLISQTEEQQFSVQVPDAVVRWGANGSQTVLYQKPTTILPSALFTVEAGVLHLVIDDIYGLVPFTFSQEIIVNGLDPTQEYYGATRLISEQERQVMKIVMLPEKCVASTDAITVWCASPANRLSTSYLEDWYKGAISSEDWLWEVTPETGDVRLERNLREVAGRTIDVDVLAINEDETKLLLRNKIDNTLWLYPLP